MMSAPAATYSRWMALMMSGWVSTSSSSDARWGTPRLNSRVPMAPSSSSGRAASRSAKARRGHGEVGVARGRAVLLPGAHAKVGYTARWRAQPDRGPRRRAIAAPVGMTWTANTGMMSDGGGMLAPEMYPMPQAGGAVRRSSWTERLALVCLVMSAVCLGVAHRRYAGVARAVCRAGQRYSSPAPGRWRMREDVEPNDAAPPVARVRRCVRDRHAHQTDRDLFGWDVLPADAATRWDLHPVGRPGRHHRPAAAPVTSDPGVDRHRWSTAATGGTVQRHPEWRTRRPRADVLLPPGRYVLGVFRSGAAGALETIHRSTTASRSPGGRRCPRRATWSPTTMPLLRPRSRARPNSSGDLSGSANVYRWSIPSGAGAERWSVSLQVPIGTDTDMTHGRCRRPADPAATLRARDHGRRCGGRP